MGIIVWFPVEARNLSFLYSVQSGFTANLPFHSFPINAVVKGEWSYISAALFVPAPIPEFACPRALVCGRFLTGIVGSNAAGGVDVCSCESCVLSGRGPSLTKCHLETPTMRKPILTRTVESWNKNLCLRGLHTDKHYILPSLIY
jgi:hypothetical protein